MPPLAPHPSPHVPRLPLIRHFARRARRERREAADRWIWISHCRRFRVVRSRCRYGPAKGPQAIAVVWRVERFEPPDQLYPWGCWRIVSRHRKGRAAFRWAEKLIKAEGRRQKAES